MEQNKNKIIFLFFGLLLIISLVFTFSGCAPPVPEVIEVTGVEIIEDDQSMKVDETLQLTAVVPPEDATNKAITWESDNPDIAAVDENGLVTALSTGTANITVTTEDGSFTDTIKITVTKPYTPSAPTVKKYEVTLGALEVNTDTPQPLNLNSRLTRQETTPAADIAGVEIEIFSNEERTINVATITTGPDGTATVNLPAGTYYYSANAEGYVDFLSELYQYFSDTLGTSSIPELGSFIVAGPREDITFFPMLKVWKVIFEAYEHAEQIPAGLSRDTVLSPPLEGVNIDIFEAVVSSTGRTVERSKVLPLVSISTGSDGTVETELPNGGYSYNASKEGYANYPSESPGNIFSIQRPLVIDRGYFEIQGADVAGTIQVPMERVYTVTFDKNNPDSTDATPTTVEVTSGDSLGVLPDPPSLDCHTFLGWATTNDATEPDFDDDTPIIEDITVYAVWTEGILLYSYGTEYVDFVDGYSFGAFNNSYKGDNHLGLSVGTTSYSNVDYYEIGYVTDDLVNLEGISQIQIIWENGLDDDINNYSCLTIKRANQKDTSLTDSIVYYQRRYSFSTPNNTNTFNVNINDLCHIGVHAATTNNNVRSNLKVQEIKLICSTAGD